MPNPLHQIVWRKVPANAKGSLTKSKAKQVIRHQQNGRDFDPAISASSMTDSPEAKLSPPS
jgi:hypothetical protein